jgi:hypothetical protein
LGCCGRVFGIRPVRVSRRRIGYSRANDLITQVPAMVSDRTPPLTYSKRLALIADRCAQYLSVFELNSTNQNTLYEKEETDFRTMPFVLPARRSLAPCILEGTGAN